ncbi:MAG: hypothetical protein JF888_00795 [Candidatus Dormibacteraeota bacterium]|uniref:YncE family protein n=1 Tax=Candidatus Dormiibacter inghamiae TaxID=3127013 RepID=A0A934NC62_9BACT|nr:hypothetical protein [Candidatus Dormibacteraeota bacterium]MBJ7605919.1 hypothetical protein [Candidatus Dormibacteraeota bacterium]
MRVTIRRRPAPLLVVFAIGVAGACGQPASPAAPSQTFKVGANPAGIAVDDRSAWVANAADGTLTQIDVASNRVVRIVGIGDPRQLLDAGCGARSIHQVPHGSFVIRACDVPRAVAVSPGAVWVARGDTRSIVRLDSRTGQVVATIPADVQAWYIAANESAVWASDYDADTVVRIDPSTNRVVVRVTHLGHGPSGLALGFGSVWVASSRAQLVTRIDATSNSVAATIPVGLTPLPVLVAFGSVWVRNEEREGNGSLSRIDPSSNRVVASVPVGPEAGRDGLDGLAALGNRLYVPGLNLEAVDPVSNRVVSRQPHTCNAVSPGGGSLWTVDLGYSVTRLSRPG